MKWDEPRALLRGGYSPGRRRLSRLLVTFTILGLIFVWTLSRLFPGIELTGVYAALASLAVIALLSRWAQHGTPCRVRISESGISQTVADDTISTWKFKDIDHCEVISTSMGEAVESVLVIELRRGRRVTIGIAPSVSLEDLQTLLKDHDVSVTAGTREARLPFLPLRQHEAP